MAYSVVWSLLHQVSQMRVQLRDPQYDFVSPRPDGKTLDQVHCTVYIILHHRYFSGMPEDVMIKNHMRLNLKELQAERFSTILSVPVGSLEILWSGLIPDSIRGKHSRRNTRTCYMHGSTGSLPGLQRHCSLIVLSMSIKGQAQEYTSVVLCILRAHFRTS